MPSLLDLLHVLGDVAVLLAVTVSGIAMCLPQLVRMLRTGSADGLSLPGLLAGAATFTGWDVLLVRAEAYDLLVTNVLASLPWYAVTLLAARRLPLTRSCVVPAAWAATLTTVALGAPGALGIVLGLGSLLAYAPQAVAAWRAPSLAGIAASTWVLCGVQGVAWIAASIPHRLLGGSVYGVVATLATVSVLTALVVRGREPALAAAVEDVFDGVDTDAPDLVTSGA